MKCLHEEHISVQKVLNIELSIIGYILIDYFWCYVSQAVFGPLKIFMIPKKSTYYCFMVSDLPYHLVIDHSPSTLFYLFSPVK